MATYLPLLKFDRIYAALAAREIDAGALPVDLRFGKPQPAIWLPDYVEVLPILRIRLRTPAERQALFHDRLRTTARCGLPHRGRGRLRAIHAGRHSAAAAAGGRAARHQCRFHGCVVGQCDMSGTKTPTTIGPQAMSAGAPHRFGAVTDAIEHRVILDLMGELAGVRIPRRRLRRRRAGLCRRGTPCRGDGRRSRSGHARRRAVIVAEAGLEATFLEGQVNEYLSRLQLRRGRLG